MVEEQEKATKNKHTDTKSALENPDTHLAISEEYTQHPITPKKLDTHLATSTEHAQHQTAPKPADDYHAGSENGTQHQTAVKTMHAGRNDDRSGNGPPAVIELSDDGLEEGSEKGPQTQPTTIGRDQPFGQRVGKARTATLTPADKDLVKRMKKGFDDADCTQRGDGKRNKGIADAQIAYDEAMALRERDEVAVEDQIGEEDALTDPDQRARAM